MGRRRRRHAVTGLRRAASPPAVAPGVDGAKAGERIGSPLVSSCQPIGAPGITWKRALVVEPPTVARGAFLAARGLTDHDGARSADPVLAVAADAWATMTAHARTPSVEVGGFLVGEAFRDEAGRWLVDARAAIPAHGAREEAAYFRLTEAAWDHVSRERAALHPDLLTVGWYHTHPGFGAFFSGTDRASQAAFFNRPWNVGVVIDPRRDEVALFRGAASERLPPTSLLLYDGLASPAPSCSPDGGLQPDPGTTGGRAAGAAASSSGLPDAGIGAADAAAAPWRVFAALAGAAMASALALRSAARWARARR